MMITAESPNLDLGGMLFPFMPWLLLLIFGWFWFYRVVMMKRLNAELTATRERVAALEKELREARGVDKPSDGGG